jgi:hypothetical protein
MYINGVEFEEREIPMQYTWNTLLELQQAVLDGWRLSDRSEHFPNEFNGMLGMFVVRPVQQEKQEKIVAEEAPIVAKEKTEAQLLRESFAEQAGAAIVEATKPRTYAKKGK